MQQTPLGVHGVVIMVSAWASTCRRCLPNGQSPEAAAGLVGRFPTGHSGCHTRAFAALLIARATHDAPGPPPVLQGLCAPLLAAAAADATGDTGAAAAEAEAPLRTALRLAAALLFLGNSRPAHRQLLTQLGRLPAPRLAEACEAIANQVHSRHP